jgi:Flp pilus assembly protein TadD
LDERPRAVAAGRAATRYTVAVATRRRARERKASGASPRRRPPEARAAHAFVPWLVGALAAVALAYAPSFEVPYLFDDHGALEGNPYLERPAELGWLGHVPENSALIARLFLSWTYGVNALLLGHGPGSYHVGNLLVHLANVVLVAVLARRALAYTRLAPRLHAGVAVAIALVWGLHPLNVQAVAYLMQRSESLAAGFELLALLAWLRADEAPGRRGWRALSLAAPFLAVATKEHGWIAPLLPLVWAWVFLGRGPLLELRRNAPFYAAGLAAWALLLGLTLHGGRLLHVGAEEQIDAWSYFVTQPEVLTHYVRLFLVPVGQSFDYDWPVATLATAWPWLALWAALFGATVFAVWKRHPAGFPAAALFLSLATTSSFLALPDLAFEHRFYLAGACTAALVLAPLARLLERAPLALFAGAACAAAALGVLTYQRSTLFQDELAVWSEAVARNPAQRRALSNVAGLLLARGDAEGALAHLRRVEALGIPSRMQTRVHYQKGNALLDLGRNAEARASYEQALETAQGDPGSIHANLGHAWLRDGRFAEARASFERALATQPDRAELYLDLAYACAQLGDSEGFVRAYERGVKLGARPQPVLSNLMTVLRGEAPRP